MLKLLYFIGILLLSILGKSSAHYWDVLEDFYYEDFNDGINGDNNVSRFNFDDPDYEYIPAEDNSFYYGDLQYIDDQEYNQLLSNSYMQLDFIEEAIKKFLVDEYFINSDYLLYDNNKASNDYEIDNSDVLHRRKRSPARRSSSRRSSSSSSSSSSSWRRRISSSRESSRSSNVNTEKEKKVKQATSSSESDKNKGTTNPQKPYPVQPGSPSSGYPSPGYPSPGYPSSGYPSSGYPSPGYPSPGYPSPGYPSQGYPSPGYPGGVHPSAPNLGTSSGVVPGAPKPGYPSQGYPSASYPGGVHPSAPNLGTSSGVVPGAPQPGYPGYPTGPVGTGYPGGVIPGAPKPGYPGYPTGQGYPGGVIPGAPKPGYPGYPTGQGYPGGVIPGAPKPGYPGYPTGQGYPGGVVPGAPRPGYPGYPTGQGYPGGVVPGAPKPGYPGYPSYPGFPGGKPHSGYPAPQPYPSPYYPKPKLTKKAKAKKLIKNAVEAYATYKITKKTRGNFLSPNKMPGMGGFGLLGHGGGSSAKLGKKVIGTLIKLQIAKYALKFGAKAAKAYFEYKLGRNLEDIVIQKFIRRYHRQRTRHFHSNRYHRHYAGNMDKSEKPMNITLGEDCNRECLTGDAKVCLFTLKVHLYQSLSRACYKCPTVAADCERKECVVASGRRKLMTLVNKQLPGPTISVCEDDTVLLEVRNDMPSEQVTIHFRGQTYPETPFMDGTPGLTQCPISPGDIFIYSFKAKNPGTSFWHAQSGLTRSEGVYGPFIVKETSEQTLYPDLYDLDLTRNTILISEDFEKSGENQYLDIFEKQGNMHVHSLMINGRGFRLGMTDDGLQNSATYSRFYLETGKRHRMRIISAVSSNCPVTISLLGQSLSVISIDGSPVTPKAASSVLISPGERFDVVVEALSAGHYWLEVKGYLECSELRQLAVIESTDATTINKTLYNIEMNETAISYDAKLPIEKPNLLDSNINVPIEDIVNCNSSNILCSQNATSTSPLTSRISAPANLTLYLALTNRQIHNEHFYSLLYYDIRSFPENERVYTPQINNLTLTLPPFPLLSNEKPLKKGFCSTIAVRRQHCVEDFCECIHLQELPLNFIVDVVIVNEGKSNSKKPQTMYFHGQKFWVLSQVKHPNITVKFDEESNSTSNSTTTPASPGTSNVSSSDQTLDRMTVALTDSENPLPRNLINPAQKDCVTVPSGGYSIIRMETNNPGFWLFESASVFKSNAGMGMVFKIGKEEDFKQPHGKKKKC